MLPLLAEPLFGDHDHLTVYRALLDHGGDARAAAADLEGDPAALLARLAVEETAAEPADVRTRLADRAGGRALADLEREARTSDDPLAWAQLIAWVKLRLEEVRDERNLGGEPVQQLVDWLTERAAEGA